MNLVLIPWYEPNTASVARLPTYFLGQILGLDVGGDSVIYYIVYMLSFLLILVVLTVIFNLFLFKTTCYYKALRMHLVLDSYNLV